MTRNELKNASDWNTSAGLKKVESNPIIPMFQIRSENKPTWVTYTYMCNSISFKILPLNSK